MKRNLVATAVALSAVCLWAGMASATLIGDTVTIGHYFPDAATPMNGATPPESRDVVAGSADAYTFYNSYPFGYQVDVEAGSILVDFSYIILSGETATWENSYNSCGFNGAVFECNPVLASVNGLGVSDLNDSTGNVLQGIVVDTNMVGWSSSRISFGDDYVLFDWKGLSFDQGTYLNATLDFAPVPEPSTLVLFACGLAGFVMRRRPSKAVHPSRA